MDKGQGIAFILKFFDLVGFYGIETIVGYLIPNPVYSYILDIFDLSTKLNSPKFSYNSIKHQSFVYTQLNDETVLFQTIKFSVSHLFALCLNVKQFY